jgi:hypothetical protein
MNYAEDRLDRKSRGTGLWDDFSHALEQNDDVLLGRTLRDCGWVRHAAYHYGRAWRNESTMSDERIGDYAQMVELAGFPEIGILALLHYRMRGEVLGGGGGANEEEERTQCATIDDPLWLQQDSPVNDCGCGLKECGQSLCSVPMTGLEPVLEALQSYIIDLPSRTSMPTAYSVLAARAKGQRVKR